MPFPPPEPFLCQIGGTSSGRSSHGVVIILPVSFLLGSCQRLLMAKIDIGGQVLMAAHGCKWSHSFYNLDTHRIYLNSNLLLKFFYLLRFLRSDLRKFWPRGVRNNNNNNNNNNNKKNKKNKSDPKKRKVREIC